MIIKVADYEDKSIVLHNARAFVATDKEQICYDLHVGESVKRPGDDTRRPTPQQIRLKPNDCIRIETREELAVPNNVFGTICSRASLTAEGLVAANLKIDPKFHGKLFVTIYNTSRNINTINTDLPFCSIFFQTLENPVSDAAPIRHPPEPKIITGPRVVEAFLRTLPFILTFIASVLSSLLASYLFGWFHPQEKPSSASGNSTKIEQKTTTPTP
jgi:deoxycytidine triphosphate deaminase